MTEAEWLRCNDPASMIAFLEGQASERKLRLFTCACGRRYCYYLHEATRKPLIDRRCRQVIDTVERVLDAEAAPKELTTAWDEIARPPEGAWPIGLYWDLWATMQGNWGYWVRRYQDTARSAREEMAMDEAELMKGYEARRFQSDLLRDLFGPLPFREVRIDPAWLACNDGVVGRLAASIYEGRAFEQMPILADALEEAGCRNEEMLTHYRQQGQPHVRGCWLLDLLLNKG
jgi:hypothetical protein